MKRIWQLVFIAVLLPALCASAQDSLPRTTAASTPSVSVSAKPTPIPDNVLALIPSPSGTPATAPAGPTMPDLSQLNQIFQQSAPGKEVIEHRSHVEWRSLKNRTVADPAVVAAKAAALAATTDLEKRNRLRVYYQTFYARMRALASTPEMAVYLNAQKEAHLTLLDQPRVRPTPTPEPTKAEEHSSEQPHQPAPEPSLPNE